MKGRFQRVDLRSLFPVVYWKPFGCKIKTEALWLGNADMLGYDKVIVWSVTSL